MNVFPSPQFYFPIRVTYPFLDVDVLKRASMPVPQDPSPIPQDSFVPESFLETLPRVIGSFLY